MILHEDTNLFKQAIRATAQAKGILEIYVEKDYWVTYALYTIFNNEIGGETIFKGGTALSKCFGIIERFSEDIDLVVIKREGDSNNQLTNKIKKISNVVKEILPEIEIEGLTRKLGMNRKTAHTYNKEFEGDLGQVRDSIIVEATWLGSSEPYTEKPISSFIYEMMLNTNQQELAETKGLLPFEINVLEPKRTFCEKIMSLVRFSYSENPIEALQNKVRHTYDLHKLLNETDLAEFFESDEFEELLLTVAEDDVVSFRNNNKWLVHHPNAAMIFNELENVWESLKTIYNGEFSNLVFGGLPNEDDVLASLSKIKERLNTIEWTITIEE